MVRLRGASVVVVLLVLAGCASSRGKAERTQFEKASARRLAAAKAGLDSLAEEIKFRTDTTRAKLAQRLDSLDVARGVASLKLDTLKATESKRWREIKGEMADMLSVLEAQTDSLRAQLRR